MCTRLPPLIWQTTSLRDLKGLYILAEWLCIIRTIKHFFFLVFPYKISNNKINNDLPFKLTELKPVFGELVVRYSLKLIKSLTELHPDFIKTCRENV